MVAQQFEPVHRLLRLRMKQFFHGRLVALSDILFQLVSRRPEAGASHQMCHQRNVIFVSHSATSCLMCVHSEESFNRS